MRPTKSDRQAEKSENYLPAMPPSFLIRNLEKLTKRRGSVGIDRER